MNGSLQYSALARLLTLNNQAHDLENQVLAETLPAPALGFFVSDQMFAGNRIAELQEEIDQVNRASLATCWLASSDNDEEYEI